MRNTQPHQTTHSDYLDEQEAPATRVSAEEAAQLALAAALDKKALEPVLLDVRSLCSYTEYILLVSGRSDRQVDAISDAISQELKKQGRRALGVEGVRSGQWALLDFGDVVVHVFHHPMRLHYDLESLWHEAPRVAIEVPDEARATPEDIY
ncbi:MAG TPA: ribosome silencing factor [Kofleriaceae bacterium]|nr:ribosome silencing factor [Kofleriaceae bacterium]